MDSFRTVTVLEHEVVPVVEVGPDVDGIGSFVVGNTWLTEADAQSLVRINDLRRGFCQLRVDNDVLEWFKAQGPGYQTRINSVLHAFRDASV